MIFKFIYKIPKDIANGFSKYFADVGPSLSSKVPEGKRNTYDHAQTKIKDSIFLTRITEFEVLRTVKKIRTKNPMILMD